MRFDGIQGNEQPAGDFLVREPGGHQLQDFVLAGADA